jgi:Ca-activated chloride channel family protein
MDFSRPVWLWLLLLLLPLGVAVIAGQRRLRRDRAAVGVAGRAVRDGAWAWIGVIGLLIVAAAGPRWGESAERSRGGPDVVLLIDVSRSMAAEDAVPNRLGLAVEAAGEVVQAAGRTPGGRVAVVAFAGRAVLRCPLTRNLGAVRDVLARLRPGEVQPGGTSLLAAINGAIDVFRGPGHGPLDPKMVVIFSDGEDLAGGWEPAVSALVEAGIVVHAIAVGDAQRGHVIPAPGAPRGVLAYHGEPVQTRRVDEPLEALSDATGGAFVRVGLARPVGLADLFARRVFPGAVARTPVEHGGPARADRSRGFILGALALGMLGSWPGRRRVLLATIAPLVLLGAGPEDPGGSAAALIARGNRAYRAGQIAEALSAFEQAARLDPRSPIPPYNAASALFRLGRFEEAADHYALARAHAGAGLRTKIDFALGNTAFALGDIPAALTHYDACLASKVPGAVYDAIRADAAVNRDYVAKFRPRTGQEPGRGDPSSRPSGPRESPQPAPESPEKPPADQPPEASKRGPGASRNVPPGQPESPAPLPPRPPEQQLDEAINNVRDALRRRLPDGPPPQADPDRKDW